MCSGQVQNFWQGLGAFSIGAIAGGVASGTGAWAFSAFGGGVAGLGGFWAGAASGAVGSAASLPIQSWGNHWVFGDRNLSIGAYVVAVSASAVFWWRLNLNYSWELLQITTSFFLTRISTLRACSPEHL